MPDFSKRSEKPEMIDSPVPESLLFRNLAELDILNRHFGGHSASIRGIKRLIHRDRREYHIVDLGCGSGDTMKQIALWARKADLKIKFTGVDVSSQAIRYAKMHCSGFPEISFIGEDYKQLKNARFTADIFHCSLFCHHLPDGELHELLKYFKTCSKSGFVINDVIRNRAGYYGSKLFTQIGGGTVLARNDGPLSVLKGLTRKEWIHMLNEINVPYELSGILFYRLLITAYA
jgi:2-polyprenyl-3-methyl-5-hydroxy-6-metoxy-1,4-benzoquinol methylase